MQVVSKLVKMDFKIAAIERDGEQLVIISDPNQTLKSKVYLTPEDVAGVLRASFSLAVLGYLIAFPVLYFRARRAKSKSES